MLRVIPLGGLGEVGKNMTVFEIGGETLVIDAGLAFPRDEHLGVDLILPDFGYLRDREVLAVILTHAHEDHVGALPYLLREVRVRDGARDAADARARQVEARRARPAERRRAARGRARTRARSSSGRSAVELVRMSHSVPDAVGVCLETAAGRRLPHGRLEARPHAGRRPADRRRQASPSSATAASTCCSATRRTPSGPASRARSGSSARRSARSSRRSSGRVLISSFASNIHRMQQAIDVAVEVGRSVSVVGRSMRKNLNIARNLGYIEAPEDILVRPADLDELAARASS